MMFSGERPVRLQAASWKFTPCCDADLNDHPWHSLELLGPALGDPTVAERAVRIHDGTSAAPRVFVRGWIIHPDRAPLHLDGWHRADHHPRSDEHPAGPASSGDER